MIRFIVRDFTYNPKAIEQERREKSKLEMQLKKQFVSAIRMCLQNHIMSSSPLSGSSDELAEGQLQSGLLCLDPSEGSASVH